MRAVTPRGRGRSPSIACTDHLKPRFAAATGARAPTSLPPVLAPGPVEVLLDEDELRGLARADPPGGTGTGRPEPGEAAEVVVLVLPRRRHLRPAQPGLAELL